MHGTHGMDANNAILNALPSPLAKDTLSALSSLSAPHHIPFGHMMAASLAPRKPPATYKR